MHTARWRRILEIRDECYADDLETPKDAVHWSDEALRKFYLSGGRLRPSPQVSSDAQVALQRILSADPRTDHRRILDISETERLSRAHINRSFRKQSLLVHPDKCPDDNAADAFKKLQAACDALKAKAEPSKEHSTSAGARTHEPKGFSSTGSRSSGVHRMATPELVGEPGEEPDFDMDGDLWDYYYWRRQRQLAHGYG